MGKSRLIISFLAACVVLMTSGKRVVDAQVVSTRNLPELLDTMQGSTSNRAADNSLVLKGADRIATTQKFVPPVTFTIVAQTDSTNLRIGYAADEIIFNWEVDQTQLRIGGGPADGKHKPGAGKIPINQYVIVQLKVEPTSMRISVDGRLRDVIDADFSQVNQSLSIFTGANGTVKVKSVKALYNQPAPPTVEAKPAAPPIVHMPTPPRKPAKSEPTLATPINKAQTSIKALYVEEQTSGQMLGLASDLILTATQGNPPGNQIPISFVGDVGQQMRMVLDDVVRSMKVKYPDMIAVQKIELSFEDKYTPKDGGSIGAAIGVLMSSMVDGFDVDPKLAITGDVTADSKVRRIGGVAAKIRGATAANCLIVAMPTENYDQIVDAMTWEGPSLLENIQVIGIGNLDDAVAVARIDRKTELAQAIDAFSALQTSLKKSPQSIHSKETQDALQKVLDLAPNHYSAKCLLALSQNKQPRKLSATATEYYTLVAVKNMLPALYDRAANPNQDLPLPAVVKDGLISLNKVRPMADPQMQPLVDDFRYFILTMIDVESGNASIELLQQKAQAVDDELAKLNANRDTMEKMLHEGV